MLLAERLAPIDDKYGTLVYKCITTGGDVKDLEDNIDEHLYRIGSIGKCFASVSWINGSMLFVELS